MPHQKQLEKSPQENTKPTKLPSGKIFKFLKFKTFAFNNLTILEFLTRLKDLRKENKL